MESYKDLKVWQKGIELVKAVYLLCELLPDSEKFGLTSQIKRCSISVPSNIAEGWGRASSKNLSNFLKIARGSLLELETQLYLCKELGFVRESDLKLIEEMINEEK